MAKVKAAIQKVALLLSALVVALTVCTGTAYAGEFTDAWNGGKTIGTDPVETRLVIQEVDAQFTKAGYSKAAVAGILGNMWHESTLTPTRHQDGGSGHGLIQHDPPLPKYVESVKSDKDYKKAVKIEVEYTEGKTPGRAEGDWVKTYQSNLTTVRDSYRLPYCKVATLDEFKKVDDAACAALVYLTCLERAGVPAFEHRRQFAEEAYKSGKLTGKAGSSSDSNDKDTSSDTSKAKSDTKEDKNALPNEDNLKGMPDRNNYDPGSQEALVSGQEADNQKKSDPSAKGSTMEDAKELEGLDKYALAQIQENRDLARQAAGYSAIHVFFMVVAFAVLIYGFLLGIGILFDKSNSIFEFSLLGLLTLGKLNLVKDRFEEDKSHVSLKRAIIAMVTCFLMAAFLFTGDMMNWFLRIYWWCTDNLSYFQ